MDSNLHKYLVLWFVTDLSSVSVLACVGNYAAAWGEVKSLFVQSVEPPPYRLFSKPIYLRNSGSRVEPVLVGGSVKFLLCPH